jgi:NAD(P)-dependent dehydrogenase (short-subunit alcohol dehydrogenase family)
VEIIRAGRGAIITGGSTGIGFATARLLAKEGAKLVLVDLDRDRAQQSAARLVSETGCAAIGLGADISEPDQVARMVDEALENLGQIDIFINSAAIMSDRLFLDSEPAEWQRMIDVCLLGPMYCLRAILPHMAQAGYGRVVCLASDAARLGQARMSYYAAAKGGVIALVKSLAQELGPNGVTLNVVSPGATDTEMRREREQRMREQMGEDKYARRVQGTLRLYPTRRIGLPEDPARLVAFLAGDDAGWITGQVLSVNGGFAMP